MNLVRIKEWVVDYERNLKRIDALVTTLVATSDPNEKLILESWLTNTRRTIKGKEEIYEKFKAILKQSN